MVERPEAHSQNGLSGHIELPLPTTLRYQGEMWEISGPLAPKEDETEPRRIITSCMTDDYGSRLMATKPESWIRAQVQDQELVGAQK